MSDARRRRQQNPFFVLGLSPSASRTEVERTGQKLLGQLSLGLESARRYETPWGSAERDEAAVRAALADLRDPARRAAAELGARAPEGEPLEDPDLSLAGAKRAFGWGGL